MQPGMRLFREKKVTSPDLLVTAEIVAACRNDIWLGAEIVTVVSPLGVVTSDLLLSFEFK
jgi:hypothetical protein